ncbi:MAG: hypothetical protein ABIR17_02710, partial [Pseudolysinimonas sp.]|uniref:hypothetical protein n=1 Tax=Pseudolysinimonas sp. TaxID=2680009 RepID=UPI0032639BBD
LMVDGAVVVSGVAGSARPGLSAALNLPGIGDAHGFSLSASVSVGSHQVCVVAVNDGAGSDTRLSYAGPAASDNCATVTNPGP